jgi:uncharacterized protein DUF3631
MSSAAAMSDAGRVPLDTSYLDLARRAVSDHAAAAGTDEPNDLARVLHAMEATLRRYVYFRSDAQVIAVVLWAAHTYWFEHFEQSPILAVTSAVLRSGKTRLFDVLELIVWRAWRVILPSDAVVYRYIEQRQPTLLLDEADAIFSRKAGEFEGLRALLNAGNRKGTVVPRVVGQGSKMKVQEFKVFCPKGIAGIGSLPATVADRSIPVRMERRSKVDPVAKFRRADLEPDAIEIRQVLEALAASQTLSSSTDVPAELDDRAAESWEPLLALADLAGGDWPQKARRAAVELHTRREQDEEALSLVLLRDIRSIFGSMAAPERRLYTAELLSALHEMEESPWGDYFGKPITAHAVAKLLRPYHIEPRQFRDGQERKRGYSVDQFADAFARYVPSSVTPAETVTTVTGQQNEAGFIGDVTDVTIAKSVTDEGTENEPMLRAALKTWNVERVS